MKQWDNETIEAQFFKALNFCYHFLKFRPRTRKEIEIYLIKKSKKYPFNQTVIEKALSSLDKEGLIDDYKFMDLFVKSRASHKQKSVWVLKKELARHGVGKDIIDKYFDSNLLNEGQLAHEALQKKWSRYVHLPKLERFRKAESFLLRRGFSFDDVKKAIADLEERD